MKRSAKHSSGTGEGFTEKFFELERFGRDYFNYVLEIGANKGTHTVGFHRLYPSAEIFAYEPAGSIFEHLCKSVAKLPIREAKKIKLIKEGLGSGKDCLITNLEYWGNGTLCEQNCLIEDPIDTTIAAWAASHPKAVEGISEVCESISITTKTLKQMVEENGIDLNKKTLIKIDCEGSEKYLMDGESVKILKTFDYICLEIHFRRSNGTLLNPIANLNWDHWDYWVKKHFSDSHSIQYCRSSGRRGSGQYYLKKIR